MKYKAGTRRRANEYEKALVEWWKKNKIFEKSVGQRSIDDSFVFYDGPPFITGMPHHGTLLSSIVKDAVPRFWTMRGKRCERRWGWDCHGLPAENFVEKQLGITDRREIGTKWSLEEYIVKARESMVANSETWEGTIDRVGRWVNFRGAYRTMDKNFMESVWWAFKTLYDEGKIYEGRKVLMYDTKFATPVSKSEVTMDNDAYQEVTDPSAYVKFKVKPGQKCHDGEWETEENTYFLAWTTTPWTLPANMALAVNPEMEYVEVEVDGEKLYIAKSRVEAVLKDVDYRVIYDDIKGSDFVGLAYEPLFGEMGEVRDEDLNGHIQHRSISSDGTLLDYETPMPLEQSRERVERAHRNAHRVYDADFVSDSDGTGIVHIAPAYGEDDYKLSQEKFFPVIDVLDDYGYYLGDSLKRLHELGVRDTDERGIEIWAGNKFIAKCLEEKGIVWKIEYIKHEYPFNPRSKQRIMYRAFPSWFFDIQGSKPLMLEKNENINWFPGYLKEGRFKKNIEQAPDWNLSRDRFWATAMPVWKGDKGSVRVVGSYDELEKLSGVRLDDYHRPWVDEIEFDLPARSEGKQRNLKIGKNSRVLFVCFSNISRSQMAKALYNKMTKGKAAEGAGVGVKDEYPEGTTVALRNKLVGEELGIENYQSLAQQILLEERGIDITDEPRVQLAPEMLKDYDLVVNIAERSQAPEWLRGENVIWWDIKDPGLVKDYEGKKASMHAALTEIEQRVRALVGGKVMDDEIDKPVEMEHFKRIEKVLDCWFESGSMPFAQLHYPFENKEKFEKNYPADFIVEYVGQVRAWFYYVHAVNTALFGENAFKNVITTGTLAGNDGRKMSKSLGNYTDPNVLMDQYSADALRFLLLSSPVLSGEDFALLDKDVSDVQRKLAMIWNVYDFFTTYAEVDNWDNKNSWQPEGKSIKFLVNPLDRWIMSRLHQLKAEILAAMEEYNVPRALSGVLPFVDDLSNWFVRRSRRRFWKSEDDGDKQEAYWTLYTVLVKFAQMMAPFIPFMAEELYQNLTGGEEFESVHLMDYPMNTEVDQEILDQMARVREVINEGLMLRMRKSEVEEQVKVRQPLSKLVYAGEKLPDWGVEIVKDEVNVKEVEAGAESWIDKELTAELREEGFARELIRAVQSARKKAGLNVDDRIKLSVSMEVPKKWQETVKAEVLAEELNMNQNYAYDEIAKVNGENITISLEKA